MCFKVFPIRLQLLAISGTLPLPFSLAFFPHLHVISNFVYYAVLDFQSKHLHSGRRKNVIKT